MLNFILGILVWQMICLIVLFATNQDETKISITSCGIFLIIINFFYLIYFRIKEFILKRNSVVVNIFKGDKFIIGAYRINKKLLKQFATEQREGYWLNVRKDANVGKIANWDNLIKVKNGWLDFNWVKENCR